MFKRNLNRFVEMIIVIRFLSTMERKMVHQQRTELCYMISQDSNDKKTRGPLKLYGKYQTF